MSNLFQNVFGGKRDVQQQNNASLPYLQGALSGTVSNGTGAGSQIANLLGLNGGDAQNQGFTNFRNSTGYQFGKDQGISSITGNAATQGLLNSGSTLKVLDTYGQNYADTQYQNYLNPLQSLLNSGLASASILGDAGKQSYGKDTETKGVGGFIGNLLSKG